MVIKYLCEHITHAYKIPVSKSHTYKVIKLLSLPPHLAHGRVFKFKSDILLSQISFNNECIKNIYFESIDEETAGICRAH